MDEFLKIQLKENSINYKRSLDRIIDKYSKLQYHDGGIEVDLDSTKTQTLERYMELSKMELHKLESKSLTDLRDESLRVQDISRNSQLDFTHQDGESDETHTSTSQLSGEDDGMSRSDITQLTVSSQSESERNFSETELQPEDQDEELEMALRSHGTLVELYPNMISRIERAWHRRNVSEAADTVLKRYRRWRQQSNRGNVNNTFIVTLRHDHRNPRKKARKMLLKENSPENGLFMRTEHAPLSVLQTVTNVHDWEAQQQSPGREGAQWRGQQQTIFAMDPSSLSETSNQQEILLNETFTVSEPTQLEDQPFSYSASPSRSCSGTAKPPLDWSIRARRLCLSAHSEQSAGRSMYASEITAVKEGSNIYSSPVRQSPLKVRLMTSFSGSPHSSSRSPKEYSVESFSRKTTRPRSLSTSLSSPLRKPPGDIRMLFPQGSNHSLQAQLCSPQSARAEGRIRLRRHLSFDSSQPSFSASYSTKTLDEDFKKLYHKFVCQNKSFFFNGPPCRLCAETSEASQGHSSSALAALALSPHRSVLRKRHRELEWDSHPQSKRSREKYCTYSPGSKRHGKEILRRCVSPSELEQSRNDFSYSTSKHAFQKVSNQQHSADTWTSQGRPLSAAEFPSQGGTFESSVANSRSPRKW
ncbi:uncharacterized protein si:dkeyp-117h8.4 isoform X2 [Anabas testudineus]|uniref:uncharacterized protein si:dkeyp-117h8.4 isoform X2 n=1 Tax=Anabas testudineus TaxID=64144 RepID=UPI000E45CB57|nr:uncharacterized protein si:dkeyp-117h8.4 isoform X2 [Anabas testudineus]